MHMRTISIAMTLELELAVEAGRRGRQRDVQEANAEDQGQANLLALGQVQGRYLVDG